MLPSARTPFLKCIPTRYFIETCLVAFSSRNKFYFRGLRIDFANLTTPIKPEQYKTFKNQNLISLHEFSSTVTSLLLEITAIIHQASIKVLTPVVGYSLGKS